MIDPLDIFALDGEGKYVWIDTAHSFLDASKAMCKHAANNACTFFVYAHKTGERTYYQVASSAEIIRLPARPL